MKKNPWGQTTVFSCLDPEFHRPQDVNEKKMSFAPEDFFSLFKSKTIDVRNLAIY